VAGRDPISRAVQGLRFDRVITGLDFQFDPSIGLVAKRVDKLGLDISSFKVPLERSIKQVMIPSFRTNFAEGGRPSWEPLAPYTVKVRGSATPILVRTGRLVRAATSFDIWSVGDNSAIIRSLGQDAWYGTIHQAGYGGFGSHLDAAKKELAREKDVSAREILQRAFQILEEKKGAPSGHATVAIPARPFIMFQDEDEDDVRDVFAVWLQEKVEEAGF
jgi:phage gpG-like protein